MLLYCVFLAGFFYALVYTPSPRAIPSMAIVEYPQSMQEMKRLDIDSSKIWGSLPNR